MNWPTCGSLMPVCFQDAPPWGPGLRWWRMRCGLVRRLGGCWGEWLEVTAAVQASRSIDGIGLIRLDQPMHQQLVAPGLLHGVPPGDPGDMRNRLEPILQGLEAFACLQKLTRWVVLLSV